MIYEQPLLVLGRNLALVLVAGLVAYMHRKKTKLAYLPVLLLTHIFFFNYVHDLVNFLLTIRIFT